MEAGQLRGQVALQYSDYSKPALPYFQELPHPVRIAARNSPFDFRRSR
jgi:hypothetical protein